jgi:hypothetical protein
VRLSGRYAIAAGLVASYGVLLLLLRAVPWHDAVALPIVLWLALRVLDPLAPGRRFLAVLAVVGTTLWLELLHVWQVGYAGRNQVFAGFFALSDAGEYYWDAERVLHGVPMVGGGLRRPLSIAVLAGILRLDGAHIRAALAVFALFWSAAIAFATGEVWRTHGRKAAAVLCILLLLFARRYVGFVQSEGLGGPLGLVAFGLLWRAASQRRAGDRTWEGSFFGALLLLAMALVSRPGPFTVLLGVLLWGWPGARTAKRGGRIVAGAVVAVATAVALQVLVQRTAAAGDAFSDYPAIFYGLLHGQEHTFVLRAQPWIGELPASARAAAISAVIRHEIAAQPWVLPVALARCLASYLYLPQGLFGFVWLNPDDYVLDDRAVVQAAMREHGVVGPVLHWVHELGVYSLVNAVVMAVAAAAFVVALGVALVKARRSRAVDPHVALVLSALAGVLLSMPLLPPWVTEGAQMHATVIAFFFALPAVCLWGERDDGPVAPGALRALAPGIAIATLAILLLVIFWPERAPRDGACDGGDDRLYAEVDRDAAATYGTAGGGSLRLGDVRRNLFFLAKRNAPFASAIERTMSQHTAMVPAYDACTQRMLYLVDAEGRIAAQPGRWLRLRATPLDQEPLMLVVAPGP